jgi:uncharacterized membrane protein
MKIAFNGNTAVHLTSVLEVRAGLALFAPKPGERAEQVIMSVTNRAGRLKARSHPR